MVHTYHVTGMTCSGCEAKIKSSLQAVDNVVSVEVSKDENSTTISMDKHIALGKLQKALPEKYKISAVHHNEMATSLPFGEGLEGGASWLETYKTILLIFFYISMVTVLVQFTNHHFDWMQWMQHFMAGFFLVFSFFKLLNLKGFAVSYVMYDVLAKRFPAWVYIYAFTELALGVAFLVSFKPFITNAVTFAVMSISIIGVLQSVLNKKKIQCACLDAVFNQPMSTVTIIEDALMIGMSGIMLFSHFI